MLKALLKKQFLELNQTYFHDRKTGKARTKGGTVLYILLFVFVFICLGFAVFSLAAGLGAVTLENGADWLYFSVMGLLAMLLGVFGSVFNTYASLYLSKDNDLLLSLPIPASKILFSRMFGVYLMSLLYSAIVWVPAVIYYWLAVPATFLGILNPILLLIVITFFVCIFTCLLGWVVAIFAKKVKGKSFIVVFVVLAALAIYYYVYFRLMDILSSIALHIGEVESTISTWLFPIYHLGRGAVGNAGSFIIFTAITAVFFALCCFVLSKNFDRIITSTPKAKKEVYVEKDTKSQSIRTALLKRELSRFAASSTYMLNCGLGVVFNLAAAAAVIIKHDDIQTLVALIEQEAPAYIEYVPVVITALCMLLASMCPITAPSISLEGKNIWILQSLPVEPSAILTAKEQLQVVISVIPSVIAAVVFSLQFKSCSSCVIYCAIAIFIYTYLSADIGLILNLRHPNLKWTNEAVPVKQSLPVFVQMFGGIGAAIVTVGAAYFLRDLISADTYMIALIVIMALLYRLAGRWLKTKGAEIFKTL